MFRVLLRDDRDPEAVYTAVREIESMAAVSTVAQLAAQIESANARLSARLDSVDRQLRLIWTFLFALLAAVTTILLRT